MRSLPLVVSLACLAPLVAAQSDDRVFADLNYGEALQRAQAENKVVLIDFFTTWCGPCRALERTTWRDPKVVQWLKEHAVALRVDAEQNPSLARERRVEAYPTIVLLRPDETEIDRYVGYRNPVELLADAQSALAGKVSTVRAQEKRIAAGDTDFQARWRRADELAQNGKYAEALEHYLWCFDQDLGIQCTGIRLSFLLGSIASLADKHPPAREALLERRDAAEKRVRRDNDLGAAYEMASVDHYLGEGAHTALVYEYARDEKKLPSDDPVRQYLFEASLDHLVAARRYDDIVREADDPLPCLRRIITRYDNSRVMAVGDLAAPVRTRLLITPALHLFEAEVATHRKEAADAVAVALLDVGNTDGEIWAGLVARARRAGDEQLARKLGAQGLAAVAAGEQEAIRQALRAPAEPPTEAPKAVSDGELTPINGTSLFVRRIGHGEPIVVVHGGPMLDHGYLVRWLAPLADSYELVFFDLRLNGRSSGEVDPGSVRLATFVDDIEALRKSLGLARIHLLSHSWGGLLAMHYAVRYGDHLQSLILLDPVAPTTALQAQEGERLAALITPDDHAAKAAIRDMPEFEAREPDAIARMLRATFAPQFHDRARLAELELYVPTDYAARSERLGALASDLQQFDLLADLRGVRAPALVVYGADEPAATITGPHLRETLPAAKLVVIPEAGHFPFVEHPDAVQRELRAFLAAAR